MSHARVHIRWIESADAERIDRYDRIDPRVPSHHRHPQTQPHPHETETTTATHAPWRKQPRGPEAPGLWRRTSVREWTWPASNFPPPLKAVRPSQLERTYGMAGWRAGWLAGVELDWKEGGGGLDRSDGDPKGCAVNQSSRSNRSRRPGRSIGRSRRPGGCVSYGPPPCFFGLIEGSEHGLNRGAESSLRKPAPGQPASRPAPPSARPRNENRASGVGRMHACRPAG